MNLQLPEAAVEYGREATRAFRANGGVDLARAAIADPGTRQSVVRPILDQIGMSDLAVAGDDVTVLLAAAELCRAAGVVALPFPVAGSVVTDDAGRPVVMVDSHRPRVDHGDLFPEWHAIDLLGDIGVARARSAPLNTRLGTFVTDMELTGFGPADETALSARALTFTCMTALGVAQASMRLTVDHVKNRQQFGRRLASFQSVQFRLAQASTALSGLEELARYTVVRLARPEPAVIVDALGLRIQTITVTREIMRTAHQLHGAIGFCDEHDLAVLTRSLQALTRLPVDLPGSVQLTLAAVETYGFDATFPVAPAGARGGRA